MGVDELTVVVTDGILWYPVGKYVHDGKDVLKIVEEQYKGRGGWEKHFVLHYTDSTSQSYGLWRSATGESLRGQQSVAEVVELIARWEFVTHTVETKWPGGQAITREFVPSEV